MRHIVIGDVHGCITELKELINKVQPEQKDKIVFLGDLIHKGPDSAAVLDYIRNTLPKQTQVVAILGNHDEKHVLWAKYQQMEKEGTLPYGYNALQHTEKYAECNLTSTDIKWLDNLPVWYQWPGYLAVHAGISSRDCSLLKKERLWSTYSSKERRTWNTLLRVRYQDSSGKMIKMGKENPKHTYWADDYDGRFGTVFFGHHVFKTNYLQAKPKIYDHAIGIDMGCVHGGYLCAAITSSHNDEITFQTIKSKQKYSPFINIMKRTP